MTPPVELTAEHLRRRLDTSQHSFTSTADAPELEGIIGQERAARAIEFGIEIPYPGFNIFATGPSGAGKTSILTNFLQAKAATRPVPPDWGYIHNFADPDRPRAVRLPPGGGAQLRDQINLLLAQAAEALQNAFSSDQYADSRNSLGRQLDQLRGERLEALDQTARGQGFQLVRAPMGMIVAPTRDGQPLTQEQFQALPEADRDQITERGQALQEALERTLRQVQEIEEKAQIQLANLDRDVALATIRPLFERLLADHAAWPEVTAYLSGIQAHMVENAADFKAPVAGEAPADQTAGAVPWLQGPKESPFDRYRLNVIVDNGQLKGAPVVVETNPTYGNLVGRVEMRGELGTLVTDYRYIKAGAMHRANGGYLLLDARVLLRQPGAWEALKQALRHARIRIEELGQQIGVLATASLAPEPIAWEVKVVLIGDLQTYYALYSLDEQFAKLFKVRADFAVEMSWNRENEEKIVQFIGNRCVEFGLPHFDLSAIAQVIEFSARQVEDQRKLSTRFAVVSDIIQEAAYWAIRAGHAQVTGEDVAKAISEQIYRSNQFEERVREAITEGAITVDVTGAVVGQVNGLAVSSLGDHAFGRPSRITARTYQGRAGVVNIEREARLSGRIHDKGMLILAGFLGGRYAQDKPLSVSASIAFEQSYDGVDGDSASSTELYALLSSLAELPIRQGIAVTGSVDQNGRVQAIGGATAKIEGFFDVCLALPGGLTGDQGVMLPAANVSHLMLRDDVVAAVSEGKFHVWPVSTIDEGIELLTGVPAGVRGDDGAYPPDSVNGRVDRKLQELAFRLQSFGQPRGKRDRLKKEEEEPQPPTVPGLPEPDGDSDEEPEQGPDEEPGEPDLPGDRPEPA